MLQEHLLVEVRESYRVLSFGSVRSSGQRSGAQSEIGDGHGDGWRAAKNSEALGDGLEWFALFQRIFGFPQEQISAPFKPKRKKAENLFLHLRFDVNQQVATTDQIHVEKRRVQKHVVRGKGNSFPDLFIDPVGAVLLDEKPRQAL